MPLRDHFRPPLDKTTSWEGFHGQWPAVIVMALNRKLPPRYLAEPRVHLGAYMEIDVTAFDEEMPAPSASGSGAERGRRRDRGVGTATADPRRRHGPAGPVRVRGPGLRHLAGPPPGRGRRDRQPRQQGPAREPPCVRDQVCSPAPAAGLGRDCRPGHDPAVQPVRRPAGTDRPGGPGWRRSRPRCMPPPAAGSAGTRPGISRPGLIPSPSASRCRHCPCGWPTTWPCPWSWKRATRRPAGSSAWRKVGSGRAGGVSPLSRNSRRAGGNRRAGGVSPLSQSQTHPLISRARPPITDRGLTPPARPGVIPRCATADRRQGRLTPPARPSGTDSK